MLRTMKLPELTLLETRVLGVLVEKEHTVPDTYPLSLNALTLGCNQKNARDPVLQASETDVQGAIDHLKALSLVIESSGSRVMRYSHNVARVLRVPSEAVALLATLWLRGPQTAAELRGASERLHRFADASSVEGYLQQLAARPDDAGGPLVKLLPRAPGAREPRWAQLLSSLPASAPANGEVPAPAAEAANTVPGLVQRLQAEVEQLRHEVAELRRRIDGLQQDADRA